MPSTWDAIADTLRHRARRLVSVRGMAWSSLVVVGVLWVVGFADWWLSLDAGWVRLCLLLSVLGIVGATIWRTLWRPLRVDLSDVDVARTIERRFPYWGDQLSSAAQFRRERYSARLGSPGLQQVITRGVDARLDEINVDEILKTTPTRRLTVIAATAVAIGVGGALWQRAAAATALTRLAMPFADVHWPRTTLLQFLDADMHPLGNGPQRTAAGEPLTLYLTNTLGELPDNVALELRLPDGREEGRALQTTVLRDNAGTMQEVGIVALTSHTGPVRFRAIGGDDNEMTWRTLEVVPAPVLSRVTISITPPSYTGQEPRTLDGAGAVEALVGSRVRFECEANSPLASAALHRDGRPPQKMTRSDGGRHVAAEFAVEDVGRGWYWFDIADVHGLSPSNPSRYELRGIADRKPTVFIEAPAGDVTVTPDADLPLRIVARDDLGVNELRLVHAQTGDVPVAVPLEMSVSLPTEETVETVWSLAPLGLAAGDRVTYHVEAVDAFDLTLPSGTTSGANVGNRGDVDSGNTGPGQVSLSAYRHIDILTAEEKRRELAARQMGILDSLQEVEEWQSHALASTAGLRIQSEIADRLRADDLDLLKQTELEQQHIREQLSDARSGAATEVPRLRQELERNRINDPQMAARLEQLAEDLRTLTDELLPTAEQSLAHARKLSQTDQPDATADSRQELRRAEQAQSAAVAVLTAATSQLGGWRRQYEITSEMDDLIADQSGIHEETQDVGRTTLAKRPDALTPQQQADLARLSDRQRRLASQLEELLKQGMEQQADTDQASPAINAMQEALRRLADRDTLSHMHEAAESLKRNDIPRTTAAQERVLNDLRDFGELLASADETTAETLLSTIEEQAEVVETLRKRQERLAREAQQALGPTADPDRQDRLERLIKEQEQLAEQAEELTRQLRRGQQRQSAQSAARAARRMRDARQGIEQEQPEETAASQQEALDDLTQLADELAQRRQEIEREMARQQVEQLADDLQQLADRQQELTTQSGDLARRQRERGSWSRTLRKELTEATDAQSALAGDVDGLRQAVREYPVIDLSLEQAGAPMREASERMEQADVGEATLERQQVAQQRLLAIVAIVRESNDSPQPGAAKGGARQPPSGPQGQQGQQQPQLLGTQLRLLRHLQADVQERTAALTEQLNSGAAVEPDIAAARESLARDQGRIAELTRMLLEEFAETHSSASGAAPQPEQRP